VRIAAGYPAGSDSCSAVPDSTITGNSSSHLCVRTQIALKWLTYLVGKLLRHSSVLCR